MSLLIKVSLSDIVTLFGPVSSGVLKIVNNKHVRDMSASLLALFIAKIYCAFRKRILLQYQAMTMVIM